MLCTVTFANVLAVCWLETDIYGGSSKFKENIKAHGKSLKHRKCRDWALAKTKNIQDCEIAKQFDAMEKRDDEKTIEDLKIKFNTLNISNFKSKLKFYFLNEYKPS